MSEVLPDRDQARRIVAGVGVFWFCWAVAALCLFVVPGVTAVGLVAAILGIVAGQVAFLALYRVWEPVTGESAWQMMFVPGFGRARRRAQLHIMVDPLRPRWIRHTLRATGWPTALVGWWLLTLLALDCVLLAALVMSDA